MSNPSTQTATATAKPVIDLNGVQTADIILTRNEETQSKAIRVGSCSAYSHAILVLDKGYCIEAVGKGVQSPLLTDALKKATYGTLMRHKTIDPNYAGWIVHYARTLGPKPYDMVGAIRSGVASGCDPRIQLTPAGLIISLVDHKMKSGGQKHDDSFFCSELIVRAFEKAGLPLINGRAHTATPRAIAKSNYLNYVKDVVKV